MYPSKQPDFIVVDVREVILEFLRYRQHYELYRKFPLQDIIGTVLASSATGGPSEYIWDMMEYKLGSEIDKYDLNLLELFFEQVMLCLDEHIGRKVNSRVDVSEYIFHNWITSDTMILMREKASIPY